MKQGKGVRVFQGGVAMFNSVVQGAFTNKVPFEQRPTGNEGVRQGYLWEEVCQHGNNKCKGPGANLACWRSFEGSWGEQY